uniref:Uncharacterized protein n=1 Tax=Tetranychus urticae TaxID=32264 RepID=T1KUK1_TETUR
MLAIWIKNRKSSGPEQITIARNNTQILYRLIVTSWTELTSYTNSNTRASLT